MDSIVILSGWIVAIGMLIWKIFETVTGWRRVDVIIFPVYKNDAIIKNIFVGAENNRRRGIHIINIGFQFPTHKFEYSPSLGSVDLWVYKGDYLRGVWFSIEDLKKEAAKYRKGYRFISNVYLRDDAGHLYIRRIGDTDIINKQFKN
jgi:hypothetical protein